MNILYCCCIKEPWLEVAKEIQKTDFNPAYWICWDEEKQLLKKELPDTVFHNISLAWKGIFPREEDNLNNPILDGFELRKYSYEELMALRMIDRLDPDQKAFSFAERQQFFRTLLRKWLNILVKEKIDLVVAPVIPHRVFDYAIYIATKILNIKFLSFRMTSFPGYLVPVNDIEEVPFYPLDSKPTSSKTDDLVKSLKEKAESNYSKAEPYYMVEQKKDSKGGIKKVVFQYLIKKNISVFIALFKPSKIYWKKFGKRMEESFFLKYQQNIKKIQGMQYKKKLKKLYESLCAAPNFNDDYIFFALHYQPEETSCPSGNIYVDQKLVVESLLKVLPKNIKIFVKEHPSQFFPTTEGEAGRYYNYYSDILSNERVKLISTEEDSFSLIDHSKAIATLTGTVGVEALFRKKPVIVYGNPWYKNLPGVISVNSEENLINIPSIILNKYTFPEKNFYESISNLLNNCVKSNHYKNVAKRSNISNEESIVNLSRYIQENY